MSFSIEPGRPIGAELERIAAELSTPPPADLDPEKRVHELRKNCKKLRAIARLVGRKDDNRRFRDIARRFAGARDAAVLLSTFDAVTGDGECPALREELARDAARARTIPPIEPIEVDWDLAGYGADDLRNRCRRAYRKARRAGRAARAEPTPERVHEWRKRVKDHWYHMRLLRSDRRGPLDELADRLGRANDLAVLGDRLGRIDAGNRLTPRIESRRTGLVARALDLGEELFAESPSSFAARLALG